MQCKKCGGEMHRGIALLNILTGAPDFVGTSDVCTVSPSGTAKLTVCLKCVACGWSVTNTELLNAKTL